MNVEAKEIARVLEDLGAKVTADLYLLGAEELAAELEAAGIKKIPRKKVAACLAKSEL